MSLEVRFLKAAELRVKSDGKIEGYAAVFNSKSLDLGGFTEIVKPGAFARAIREGQDVRCLFNHDANQILGRSKNGTLQLAEDSTGLAFSCQTGATRLAQDVYESIRRGDVDGCSFSFFVKSDNWTKEGAADLREVLDVDLVDVGPVVFPAYPATSVAARSLWPHGVPLAVGNHRTAERVEGCYSLRRKVFLGNPEMESDRARARVRLALFQ